MQNWYNKSMDLEIFIKWFNAKFLEWRGDSRRGVSDFARYLGIKQQTVSLWLNGGIKSLPTPENLAQLAKTYPEVYEVVGLNSLDFLPGDLRDSWQLAVSEIRRTYRENGIIEGSPAADKIALEIFAKFGFILTSTK